MSCTVTSFYQIDLLFDNFIYTENLIMIDKFIVGRIINTHGVKGELKVKPETDDITRFNRLKKVFVILKGKKAEYEIISSRLYNDFVLLTLKGVDTMDKAIMMKNAILEIPREDAIELPEGSYFIGDIIGCTVRENGKDILGVVTDVLQTGSNDVYEVKDPDGKMLYIPAIGDVVIEINVEQSVIDVKLIPGLKEVYYEN